MKVYITKFALTKGIFPVDAAIIGDRAVVQGAYPWTKTSFYKGDWHTDPSKALARAATMAAQKASSLEVQAAELRKREFAIQEEVV